VTARIVLSALLLCVLALAACAESWSADDQQADDEPTANSARAVEVGDAGATGNGIGTSPSVASTSVKPCGLWFAHAGGIAAAEDRHLAAPADPDMRQDPRPGGLSCSALIAVAAEHQYFAGRSVVYYVAGTAP
jgi:hypothetical protein